MATEIDTSTMQGPTAVDPDSTELRGPSAGTASAPPPPKTLRGQFVLENKLGDGGMGTVFKALDLHRQKYNDPRPFVALKVLNSDVLANFPSAPLALQREASRAMALTHPNIVRIYAFYDIDPTDQQCFITMELLEGKTLDALLRSHPRGISRRHAFFLLEEICKGLQFAHDRGLVHSDLKPSNIFITDDGTIRILDLGIATPLRGASGKAQDTYWNPRDLGALTPTYASLEQWLRMDADARDDIYSLGVMTYEMLSGKHPFETVVDGKTVRLPAPKASKASLSPAPIRGLTRAQNAALARALRFERDNRTATIEQFYAEIAEGARETRRAGLAIGAAALVMLVAGIAGWFALRNDAATNVIPSSAPAVTEPEVRDLSVTQIESDTTKPADPPVANADERLTNECGVGITPAGLETLLERGLTAQANVLLGGESQASQTNLAELSRTENCIRELAERGIQSAQSVQWLKDAAAISRPDAAR